MTRIVMPIVGEPDRDTIVSIHPDFFDRAIIEFFVPFSGEKPDYLFAADKSSDRLRQTLSDE